VDSTRRQHDSQRYQRGSMPDQADSMR